MSFLGYIINNLVFRLRYYIYLIHFLKNSVCYIEGISNPHFSQQNPKGFAIDLLEFLSSHWKTVSASSPSIIDQNTVTEIVMALESLSHIITNNPGKDSIST